MRRLRCFRYMLPVQALTRRCLSHTEGASCPTRSSRKQRAPIKPSPTRSSTSIWTPLARALMKCRTSPTRRSGVICPTLGSRADTPAALCAHCRVTRLRWRSGRRDVLLADPEPLGDHPQGPGLPGRVEPSAAPTASDQRVRRRLRPGRTHHDLLDRRASILAYWFKTHPSRWEQKQPAVGQAGRRRLTADGPRSPARITLRCRRGGPARVTRRGRPRAPRDTVAPARHRYAAGARGPARSWVRPASVRVTRAAAGGDATSPSCRRDHGLTLRWPGLTAPPLQPESRSVAEVGDTRTATIYAGTAVALTECIVFVIASMSISMNRSSGPPGAREVNGG